MIRPLAVATGGWLGQPLSIASDGYLDYVGVTIRGPGTPESVGSSRKEWIRRPDLTDDILQRDDAEIVELVTILFAVDIL